MRGHELHRSGSFWSFLLSIDLSLLEAFHRTKDPCQDWGHLLRFLSPLTVRSLLIKMT